MLNGKPFVRPLHLGNAQTPGQRQSKALPGLNRFKTRIAAQGTLLTSMVRGPWLALLAWLPLGRAGLPPKTFRMLHSLIAEASHNARSPGSVTQLRPPKLNSIGGAVPALAEQASVGRIGKLDPTSIPQQG